VTVWRRLDDVPRGDAARVWLYTTARSVLANQRGDTKSRFDELKPAYQELAASIR
jgi:RNA polymerase sigma-70 factor (ECF subfamily)